MPRSLQARVEEIAEDAIEEIAEEFGLRIPYYPEVVWAGPGTNLGPEDLGFFQKDMHCGKSPDDNYEDFGDCLESARENGQSFVIYGNPTFILIGGLKISHVAEECSHFLFEVNPRQDNLRRAIKAKDPEELFYYQVIDEAVGFLGSRVLIPERTPEGIYDCRKTIDLMGAREEDIQNLKKVVARKQGLSFKDVDWKDFLVHQQGWNLGERIYHDYLFGNTTTEEIRDLYNETFREKNPSEVFLRLRLKYWPPNMGDNP